MPFAVVLIWLKLVFGHGGLVQSLNGSNQLSCSGVESFYENMGRT